MAYDYLVSCGSDAECQVSCNITLCCTVLFLVGVLYLSCCLVLTKNKTFTKKGAMLQPSELSVHHFYCMCSTGVYINVIPYPNLKTDSLLQETVFCFIFVYPIEGVSSCVFRFWLLLCFVSQITPCADIAKEATEAAAVAGRGRGCCRVRSCIPGAARGPARRRGGRCHGLLHDPLMSMNLMRALTSLQLREYIDSSHKYLASFLFEKIEYGSQHE